MGVDSIWLSPFYENGMDNLTTCPNSSNCDDTYQNYDWNDVTDHTLVGARFGSENDLDQLLDELRKNGNCICLCNNESIHLLKY